MLLMAEHMGSQRKSGLAPELVRGGHKCCQMVLRTEAPGMQQAVLENWLVLSTLLDVQQPVQMPFGSQA